MSNEHMGLRVGQKVSLLHSNECGVVERLLPGGQVQVLIEDVFPLELPATQVVASAPPRTKLKLPKRPSITAVEPPPPAQTAAPQMAATATRAVEINPRVALTLANGLYVSASRLGETNLPLQIVNHSDDAVVLAVYHLSRGQYRALLSTTLQPRSAQALMTTHIERFESDTQMAVGYQWFPAITDHPTEPQTATFRLRNRDLMKAAHPNPYGSSPEAKAHFVQVAPRVKPEDAALALRFASHPVPKPKKEVHAVELPPSVVDLHIEELLDDLTGLNRGQMLNLQIEHFEQRLEQAIAHRLRDITFVHGIGNAILRTELHNRLRQRPEVRDFQAEEKYGYGATRVFF